MIKSLIQVTVLLFSVTMIAHGARPVKSESVDKNAVSADIMQACTQNKMQFTGTVAELNAVCKCSVERMVEFILNSNFSDKNPTQRAAWLKKYYLKELSQAELDRDPFDIFEFAAPINEECLVKAKTKKAGQK